LEPQATCKAFEAWILQPHGLTKTLPQIHNDILFDRTVTAQLYCPKKVKLTAYSAPALVAVDHAGRAVERTDSHQYKYLPTKKDILTYAAGVAEKLGPDVHFDIVTRDALAAFQNGRARIGGMPAEQTGEFSSVVVYRHRPPADPERSDVG
jgi:hypothetical protein